MKFHRINFYEPKPEGIRCISFDDISKKIAVSRADNSIEIWDLKGQPYLKKIIPGDPTLSVEAISWCGDRLFSCGLHGYVLEYDLQTLIPSHQLLISSGCPIWCMALNKRKTQLAIGNEEGYVSLIEIVSSGLVFDRRFDKQEGSILCLAWHKEENIIATGSADVIRTWDVKSGHVLNRIMLSRVNQNTPNIVWCIALLSDMTIVSGDSSGKISFWDGNTGTLISSSGSKKGDILSICTSDKEDIIYTSGVEPTIMAYMQSHSNGLWMKSVQRVVHTHDVRALQLVDDYLISGGDDCNLVFTKYPPRVVLTFYPYCQKHHAVMAAQESCILLQYPTAVELWKIGQNNPVHLLRIKPKSNEKVTCSSISPDGKWIAYSTQYKIRLFSIFQNSDVENSISMSKIEMPSTLPSSSVILFSKNSQKLIMYGQNNIFIVKCGKDFSDIEFKIEIDPDMTSEIHLMEITNGDCLLACAFEDGNVFIYCLKTLKVICKLPTYRCLATALTFDLASENLIVAYSDRKVVEYCITSQAYTNWCKQEVFQNLKTASLYPIISMCLCQDKLFLLEENAIHVVEKEALDAPAHKRSKKSERCEILLTNNSFKTLTNYEHLSSIHSFNKELVLVQIPSKVILNSLTPPIWKKIYGT